jgi:hypothetical protein
MSDRPTKLLPPPGRPLTSAQGRALEALVRLCPLLGQEAATRAIAADSGLAAGAATLALRGLERRRLAVCHGVAGNCWSPTLTGRARMRDVSARETPADERRESA